MSVPTSAELLTFLQEHGFLTLPQLQQLGGGSDTKFADARVLARELVDRNWLTPYQANQLLLGRGNDLLLGSYRIVDRLGEGGMGQVFKAHHVSMDRLVALKVIARDRVSNPTAVVRFYREVRAVAKLSHPNIVIAFEVNEAGQTPFLAMEYVEGIDLAKLVQQSGPLPIPRACDYIHQAAAGLQHAHEKGLVHRDIKPGNLMVTRPSPDEPPLIKILDFGLARFESESDHTTRLTQLGKVMGTVDYVAPEQAQNPRTADIRADIYSLGCTLFYLLTGKPPFEGEDTVEKIGARVLGNLPSIRQSRPEVSPALERVLSKMAARNPENRYQTPAEVAKALQPHTQSEGESRRVARTVVDRSVVPSPNPPTLIEPPVRTSTPIQPKKETVSSKKSGERELRPPRLKTSVWIAIAGIVAFGAVVLLGAIVGGIVLFANSRAGDSKDGDSTKGPALAQKDANTNKSKPAGLDDKSQSPADPKKLEPMPDLKKPDPEPKNPEPRQLEPRLSVDLGGGVKMQFVLIPKGKFQMGSPWNEEGRLDGEDLHEVEITHDYWLGKTTITRGQFRAFVEDDGYKTEAEKDNKGGFGGTGAGLVQKPEYTWKNPGFAQTDEHPVVIVSWNDAKAFCAWVKRKTGKEVRLPSEAEWERACRGGERKGRYFFGDDEEDLAKYANVADASFRAATSSLNYGIKADDGYAFTAPVGKFKPNQYGLYDMHGNIWQWCEDYCDAKYYANSPMKDPLNIKKPGKEWRVIRGGSWTDTPGSCRAASRNCRADRTTIAGFRVCLPLD